MWLWQYGPPLVGGGVEGVICLALCHSRLVYVALEVWASFGRLMPALLSS